MVCVFKCNQADYWWGHRVTKFAIKGTGESHKLFGDKILKIPRGQPTNFSYFLIEAIMYRHEIVSRWEERDNLTLHRQSEIEGIYFSQTSVIYFCRGFRKYERPGFTVKETT